jgi:hypothetical protein
VTQDILDQQGLKVVNKEPQVLKVLKGQLVVKELKGLIKEAKEIQEHKVL